MKIRRSTYWLYRRAHAVQFICAALNFFFYVDLDTFIECEFSDYYFLFFFYFWKVKLKKLAKNSISFIWSDNEYKLLAKHNRWSADEDNIDGLNFIFLRENLIFRIKLNYNAIHQIPQSRKKKLSEFPVQSKIHQIAKTLH